MADRSFLALPVVAAVTVWTNVGYVALFFLAGILAIPPSIHAAARIDGATTWQRFWRDHPCRCCGRRSSSSW